MDEIASEQREREKAVAIAAVENAIAGIERRHREPDLWERVFLVEAIGAISRGCYAAAQTEAMLALTTPDHRSPGLDLPTDDFYDRCNLVLLRQALQEAKSEPVRRSPQYGPAAFAHD
jgi:hypothetical protein